jgi:molybdopterin biosynthesis enzyme MoaB
MAGIRRVTTRVGLLYVPQVDLATGDALRAALRNGGLAAVVLHEGYAADTRHWVEETLRRWADEEELDLILTVGGTLPAPGPSGREIVPEATLAVLERPMPGLVELMRWTVGDEVPRATLHRGVAGIRGRTLIVNLPAGAAAPALLDAVVEDVDAILAHLREDVDAPGVADGMAADSQAVGAESPPAPPSTPGGKGLTAADFAAFLQRRKGEQSDRGA